MILLACLLLAAPSASVDLLDETSTIAAGKWNFYPSMHLRQLPVRIDADFEVQPPGGKVQLALLTHGDTERLFKDEPHGVLAATGYERRGRFTFQVPRADDYDIVVDNREGNRDVTVRVRVALHFAAAGPVVVTASPARQWTVIALSALFFLSVVTYSARRILRAIGRPG
ncbi:MAG: hypothetical protein JST11_11715 [Acidobacteria bacterium]|nr:hypothetical protein [Acidobacteriota bacterium]